MQNATRQPYKPRSLGVQFSLLDALVLVFGGIAVATLWGNFQEFALLIGFVVGHFFLFCNIFRIHRKYELAWAAIFMLDIACATAWGGWTWTTAMLVQVPVTIALVAAEMLSNRYHGLGCSIVNARQVKAWTIDAS